MQRTQHYSAAGCGELYDDLMNILEESNGWARVLEYMSDENENEDVKKAATIFYHNNADIPIPDIEFT